MSDIYRAGFAVRDYECDMQGIVNNATYQNYLEHARHEFLKTRGLNFADLTRQGINVVVLRAELDYLLPLRSGDLFEVTVAVRQHSRLRLAFDQEIWRPASGELLLRACFHTAALNPRGRPCLPPELEPLLTSFDSAS